MPYIAGLYLRVSRDDGDVATSESIKNQKDFLIKYSKDNAITIGDFYIDDGISGTTFDRPEFNRLICDIEKCRINTVITKDLSRLGRDYILTGHYLEKYFPQKNIRYIAVNDCIDTFSTNNNNNDMSPFKAVFNDFYAKDISKKVRTALTTKKEQGKFIGSVAPFGYIKDPNDKNHLVIDNKSSMVVRKIYDMFLSGETLIGIANRLSKDGIQTPSQMKNLKATQKRFAGLWNEVIIKRILTSQTYIGNLVQNKSKKVSYKVNKKINLEKNQWIIVNDTHEPIISKRDFENVQLILAKRSYNQNKRKGESHLLTGLVFCADCLCPMSFIKQSQTRTYLVCSNWRKHAKLGLCTSHSIRESYVEQQIKQQLKIMSDTLLNSEYLALMETELLKKTNSRQIEKKVFLENQNIVDTALLSLYKDKSIGLISEQEYIDLSKQLNNEKLLLQKSIENIDISMSNEINVSNINELTSNILKFEQVDRTSLLLLINKIQVGKNKEITIEFNFDNPFDDSDKK